MKVPRHGDFAYWSPGIYRRGRRILSQIKTLAGDRWEARDDTTGLRCTCASPQAALDALKAAKGAEKSANSVRAAQALRARAKMDREREAWALPTELLLDPDLVSDRTKKWVVFWLGSWDESFVAITRDKLAQCRVPLRKFCDLRAWVDRDCLHFRWRGGKGGLDLASQLVFMSDRLKCLVVELDER